MMRHNKGCIMRTFRLDPDTYTIFAEVAGHRNVTARINQLMAAYNGDGRIRVAVDIHAQKMQQMDEEFERKLAEIVSGKKAG